MQPGLKEKPEAPRARGAEAEAGDGEAAAKPKFTPPAGAMGFGMLGGLGAALKKRGGGGGGSSVSSPNVMMAGLAQAAAAKRAGGATAAPPKQQPPSGAVALPGAGAGGVPPLPDTTYTLAQLKDPASLPASLDRKKLVVRNPPPHSTPPPRLPLLTGPQEHLRAEDFQEAFSMDRERFFSLANFVRNKKLKAAGLFH